MPEKRWSPWGWESTGHFWGHRSRCYVPACAGQAPACGLICGQRKQGVTLRSQRVTLWNQRVRTGSQRVTNRAQLVEQQCEFSHRLLTDTESVLKTGVVGKLASRRRKRQRSCYPHRTAFCCVQDAGEKGQSARCRREQALERYAWLTISLRQSGQRQKRGQPSRRVQGAEPCAPA